MNYPFRKALMECFVEDRMDVGALGCHLQNLLMHHPEPANLDMLNVPASHDTDRLMTLALRSGSRRALESLKLVTALQFTWRDAYSMDSRCFPWSVPDPHCPDGIVLIYNPAMANEIETQPDPVIEAYKNDIDHTLIRRNLALTVEERLLQLARLQEFSDELRRAGAAARKCRD